MMQVSRLSSSICIVFALFSSSVSAEAPVVDNSENFTLFEDKQTFSEQNAETPPYNLAYNDNADELSLEDPLIGEPLLEEEVPIAKDTPSPKSEPLAFDEPAASSGDNKNVILLDKIQSLQQEVQELRGQLEVQAHDLKLLQQQQLAFYKDLDSRLQQDNAEQLSQHKQVDAKTQPSQALSIDSNRMPALKSKEKTNPANEQISYLAAYELVKSKQYDRALNAMQTFVAQYPQSGYVANAQYWLGELYLVQRNYSSAINHFETVLQHYPTSSKASASLLKIGYALAASGKTTQARNRLQQVVKKYPDTNAALLATNKLQSLGS